MMLTAARRRQATRRAAFTLLEVLVVVAILVILAGVASISIFRYMEDAKVGRAKADMQAIEKAYKTYYTQNGHWPESPQDVAPLFDQGIQAFNSPWADQGVTYQVQIVEMPQSDGTTIQRPLVQCQPPGKPLIQYPER